MNNKSLIQLQIEGIQAKGEFEKQISTILETFDVQDTVFAIKHGAVELTRGYFVESKTYDDLTQAVREMDNNQALRIVENKTFIVGDVYNSLTECMDEEKVFNIEFLEDVY